MHDGSLNALPCTQSAKLSVICLISEGCSEFPLLLIHASKIEVNNSICIFLFVTRDTNSKIFGIVSCDTLLIWYSVTRDKVGVFSIAISPSPSSALGERSFASSLASSLASPLASPAARFDCVCCIERTTSGQFAQIAASVCTMDSATAVSPFRSATAWIEARRR